VENATIVIIVFRWSATVLSASDTKHTSSCGVKQRVSTSTECGIFINCIYFNFRSLEEHHDHPGMVIGDLQSDDEDIVNSSDEDDDTNSDSSKGEPDSQDQVSFHLYLLELLLTSVLFSENLLGYFQVKHWVNVNRYIKFLHFYCLVCYLQNFDSCTLS